MYPLIKEIVWESNIGYIIKEREIGTSQYGNVDYEKQAYDLYKDNCFLIKNSKLLKDYKGLTNDYQKDASILRILNTLKPSVSAYEAGKYIQENKTKSWTSSPYSNSWYSTGGINWGHKPEGSLRVSNHWNFGENGEHCRTAEPLEDVWAVCQYRNGLYYLIKKF